jgi:flagella basal body P-ring formation protein FlgA
MRYTFLLLTLFSHLMFAKPEVRIQSDIIIFQSKLFFQDCCEILQATDSEKQELLKLQVNWTSDKAEMAAFEFRDLFFGDQSVKIKSSSKIHVHKPTAKATKSDVQNLIAQYSQHRFPNAEIDVQQVKLPFADRPQNNLTIDFHDYNGRGEFLLNARLENETDTAYWIRGIVRVRQEVPLLMKDLRFGERISSSDVQLRKVDISYVRGELLEIKDFDGFVMSRNAYQGSVLTKDLIKPAPMVQRSQSVKILLEQNGIQIETMGTAQEDGFKDAFIKVKSDSNNKILSGKVAAPGLIRIE